MRNFNNNYEMQKVINDSGLYKKKWFQYFKFIAATATFVLVFLIAKLNYEKYETILLSVFVAVMFILLGYASFFIFKKNEEDKSRPIFRILIAPVGFIIFGALIVSISLLGISFLTNLFIKLGVN